MRRLVVPTAAFALGAACDALSDDPPAFPSTAFLELAELATTTAGADHALVGDGRYLLRQVSGFTFTYDLEAGIASGAFPPAAQVQQGGESIEVADDLIVLPAGQDGVSVVRLADDGAGFNPVVRSSIPADQAFVGPDRVALWTGAALWILDRATFFARDTGPDDALFTMEIGLLKAVAVRGDVVWAASDLYTGATGWDISDPTAPVELYLVGDGFNYELGLHDDLLFVRQGYDGGAYDVSDPYHPVPVARLYGGMGMSVYDGHYYGVGSKTLYILDLEDPSGVPVPVHAREMVSEDDQAVFGWGDCTDVVAGRHGVFVACDEHLFWLGPNTP